MPAGRPRKYGPIILETMEKYIEDCSQYGDLFPSIAGCAEECGVVRETFHQWDRDEDKPEFSHMLKKLLQKQERKCLHGGASGDYNAAISKLVLAKHGYSDKVEQTQKGADGGPVKEVHIHMTQEEASQAYKDALNAD